MRTTLSQGVRTGIPVLIYVLATACATPHSVRVARRPAEATTDVVTECRKLAEPRDRQLCAFMERDAIEALRIFVDYKIFEAKWAKMRKRDAAVPIGPAPSSSIGFRNRTKFGWLRDAFSVSAGHFGLGILSVAPLLTSEEAKAASVLAPLGLTRRTSVAFGGYAMVVTLPMSVLFDVFTEYFGKDSSFVTDMNWALSNTSITPKEYSESVELEKRKAAAFRNGIRTIAYEMAEKFSALLALRPTDTLSLESDIEDELVRQFSVAVATPPATRKYGAYPEIKFDIAKLLKARGADVDLRIRALDEVIAEAKIAERSHHPERLTLLERAENEFSALETDINDILGASSKQFEAIRTVNQRELDPLLGDAVAIGNACEDLREKIRLHWELTGDGSSKVEAEEKK